MAKKDKILAVDIERSGFPILIGNERFFFATSEENIAKFLEFKENPQKYINKVRELSKRSDAMYDKITKEDELPSLEEYIQSTEDQKEALTIMYDIMLGEGSFKRLYEAYPDVLALARIAETVIDTINIGADRYRKQQLLEQKKKAAKDAQAKKASKKRGV